MNSKKWTAGMSVLIFIVALAGCGGTALSPNLANVSSADKGVVVDVPPLERMETFNTQIANVKDEASASQALETFSSHVASEIGGGALSAQSQVRILEPRLVAALAKKEADARQDIRLHGADAELDISSQKVANALNWLVPESAANPIRPDEIEAAKEGVRAELPAMAVSKAKNMTPLEATVVGYTFVTGDRGDGAPQGNEGLSPSAIGQFVERILEEGHQ